MVNSRVFVLFLVSIAATAGTMSVMADEPWVPLFNGENLDGFHTMFGDKYGKNEDPLRIVQVYDGMIHLYKDLEHGSDIPWAYFGTNKEYSDYHLRLEYQWGTRKFGRRTNNIRDSGVLYHCVGPEVVWPMSVECQIQEGDTGDLLTIRTRVRSTADPDKEINIEERLSHYKEGGTEITQGKRGRIARVVKDGTHEVDGWNRVEVIVKGDRAVHIVNGHVNNRCTQMQMPDPQDPDK